MQMPSDGAAAAALALVGAGLARPARSAAAAPWCGGCSGRCGRCPGRSRTGCRARSARSRRRWWPARSGARCARWNTRCCSADDSRAYSGRISVSRRLPLGAARRRCRGSPARRRGTPGCRPGPRPELVHRVADRLDLVAVVGRRRRRRRRRPRPAGGSDLDRVGPAGDLDDRGVAEVAGEALRVDGRRGDDRP